MRGALEGAPLPATYADIREEYALTLTETGETSNSFSVRHAVPLDSVSNSLQESSSVCQRSAQQASVEAEKYLQGWTVVALLQLSCLSNLSFKRRPTESEIGGIRNTSCWQCQFALHF